MKDEIERAKVKAERKAKRKAEKRQHKTEGKANRKKKLYDEAQRALDELFTK